MNGKKARKETYAGRIKNFEKVAKGDKNKLTNGRGYYIIDPLSMRSWRNWQTRKTKDLVANTMQVQFLSTAPLLRFIEIIFNKSLYYILKRIIILLTLRNLVELARFLAC